MSEILRREVVYLITAIVVIVMIVEYFFGPATPEAGVFPQIGAAGGALRTWAIVISAMALALGAVNLMRVHGNVIRRRESGRWIFSVWLIFIFALATIMGLLNVSTNPKNNPIYAWLFDYPYTSLSATLYAITGFYIASAAYRAFRARNVDAALLLIAGIFVLLKNAPIGEVIWSGFPVIGGWFNDWGQVPAMRTFLITSAFGLMAYGFRTLLGKERGFYGEVGGA